MGKDNDKQSRKSRRSERRRLKKIEERSDQRTAEFLVRRLEGLQEDMGDLIPDLQTFDHYWEIQQVSFCIRIMDELRKKYRKRADGQV